MYYVRQRFLCVYIELLGTEQASICIASRRCKEYKLFRAVAFVSTRILNGKAVSVPFDDGLAKCAISLRNLYAKCSQDNLISLLSLAYLSQREALRQVETLSSQYVTIISKVWTTTMTELVKMALSSRPTFLSTYNILLRSLATGFDAPARSPNTS